MLLVQDGFYWFGIATSKNHLEHTYKMLAIQHGSTHYESKIGFCSIIWFSDTGNHFQKPFLWVPIPSPFIYIKICEEEESRINLKSFKKRILLHFYFYWAVGKGVTNLTEWVLIRKKYNSTNTPWKDPRAFNLSLQDGHFISLLIYFIGSHSSFLYGCNCRTPSRFMVKMKVTVLFYI